jgi:hypothetical protein
VDSIWSDGERERRKDILWEENAQQKVWREKTSRFLVIFCSLGRSGNLTQGLTLARQALYYLSHAPSPFFFGYFGDRVWIYAWTSLDRILLFTLPVAGMLAWGLLLIEMGGGSLSKFLSGLALNHHPPDLLPSC